MMRIFGSASFAAAFKSVSSAPRSESSVLSSRSWRSENRYFSKASFIVGAQRLAQACYAAARDRPSLVVPADARRPITRPAQNGVPCPSSLAGFARRRARQRAALFGRRGLAGRGGHRLSRAGRQLAMNVIGRVAQLPNQRGDHLAIGGEEAVIGGRAVGLDRFVQGGQRVIGNEREHVMLDVIVHVPVDEAAERIEIHGAAVQPMVEDVVGKSDMLGEAGENMMPAAVNAWEADQHQG